MYKSRRNKRLAAYACVPRHLGRKKIGVQGVSLIANLQLQVLAALCRESEHHDT